MLHPGAGAFRLGPETGPRVLLFHGLTGAPSELWPLGVGLAAAGLRVEAPVWPGHGTSPAELARVRAEALREAAATAIRSGSPPVALVGLSMGGLVALAAAAGLPGLGRLVLLAPAMRLVGSSGLFDRLGAVPLLSRLPLLVAKGGPAALVTARPCSAFSGLTARAAEAAATAPAASGWDGRYSEVPLSWGRELRRLRAWAAAAVARVPCPVLVCHGLEDRTAGVAGSLDLVARFAPGRATLRLFPASPHVLMLGPERAAVAGEVAAFLAAVAGGDRAAHSA